MRSIPRLYSVRLALLASVLLAGCSDSGPTGPAGDSNVYGYDVDNPVLVFLHGGPGSPAMPYARFSFGGLERHFTVVSWDQRGCGKSYHEGLSSASITIDGMLSDTHELIQMMRARFGVQKVYLMGLSWGSLLGALTEYTAANVASEGAWRELYAFSPLLLD